MTLMAVSPHHPGDPADVPALLRRASTGDEAAWRDIVSRYARRIYALMRSRRLDHDLAEDLTQSVFVTVAEHVGRPAAGGQARYEEQGRFEAWLFRVAMNRIRDEMRRRSRHAAPTDPETIAAVAPADATPEKDHESLDALGRAVERLNEQERTVIELRHHGGMNFKDIADLVEEPLGTVLARHHRALKKLKSMLTEVASD